MAAPANRSLIPRKPGALGTLVLLWLLFPLAVFAAQATTAYSVADFVTCESAKMEAPHNWHLPKVAFRTDDREFFAWAELNDASGVFPVEMKLHRPDGTFYGKETQTVRETNGIASWWRMAARWRIKDDGPEIGRAHV